MSRRREQPSPDFPRWEELLEEGVEPPRVATQLGLTCSALRRADPVRHAEALAIGRAAQARSSITALLEKARRQLNPSDYAQLLQTVGRHIIAELDAEAAALPQNVLEFRLSRRSA